MTAPRPLVVAIQMDPIESINIDTDSTFVLALEAQSRGHNLVYYQPGQLALEAGRLNAQVRPVALRREKGSHAALGAAHDLDLGAADVVLMRQDPPFDMAYITATHLLERIHPRTLVVNDPFWVRNCPEKILVTEFPDLMPPTLITADLGRIKAFRAAHGDIIVKPLYGNGGAGVFHLAPGDENLGSLIELFQAGRLLPAMVQRYIPEVRQGDKRIILVDGEPVGALDRLPAAGEARANLHVGGKATKTRLTARETEICDRLGPTLRNKGLIFAGIDVIGGWLTEINVTSPTGIQEINRFDDIRIEALIWDAIERRLAAARHKA